MKIHRTKILVTVFCPEYTIKVDHHPIPLLHINPVCPLTAAGGFGCVQQRHAGGRKAAAGGVQLHCPDRRLWTSWTTQEGLQTLQ